MQGSSGLMILDDDSGTDGFLHQKHVRRARGGEHVMISVWLEAPQSLGVVWKGWYAVQPEIYLTLRVRFRLDLEPDLVCPWHER